MKNLLIVLFTFPLFFGCSQGNYVQETKRVTLAEFNPSNFRFMATSAQSMRTGSRLLEGGYDVVLKNDTLYSQLPYYGVSSTAPIGSDEAGIRFTTTKFSATKKNEGPESMEISIEVKDQRFVRSMNFTIYSDGTGRLDVLSNFRDAMSFQGHLTTIPVSQD